MMMQSQLMEANIVECSQGSSHQRKGVAMETFIKTKAGVNVARHTIVRLSLYYRVLEEIVRHEKGKVISSTELGRLAGVGAASIRKDLSCFGEFGKKGVGYQVDELMRWIGEILGYTSCWNIAMVGVGVHLMPINQYLQFMPPGFSLKALFDIDESYEGTMLSESGMEVCSLIHLEKVLHERKISIGLLAVTAEYAQYMANRLVAAGICAISNFSPVNVSVPDHVALVQMSFASGLSQLSYQLQQRNPICFSQPSWLLAEG
ncbi:MAG TPA: redox-sensing transcriptional repressor Rex [Patescibacteria group bacterium]|nr:redox-sensing transcriptional repressor Rex [Patescibacteria group bacterium]